ncbi:cation:proton antiporter [Zavarzinella formosa]|uniref:cation:proton antiporter n=1 Tax=Zavarzinella formosa TaxID=360055 RepID=UPI001EE666FC|nr:sodium:proton antiporter [Zavarzinella formosa]
MLPLLYAAAFQTEWPAFRRAIRPILSLAIGLVQFATVLVAWAAHDLVGLSWPAAFVLGAIVSPPDAVAAVAVTRLVRVPRLITTLLEGESLVNDASALVALCIAVAVVAGEAFRVERAAFEFVTFSADGVAIGLSGAWVIVRTHEWLRHTRLGEPKLHIALSLSTPYLLYLPAERVEVSGVLAAVSAGLYVGWFGLCNIRHNWCAEAKAVWGMVEFLLTGLIFLLIGFQLPVFWVRWAAIKRSRPCADTRRSSPQWSSGHGCCGCTPVLICHAGLTGSCWTGMSLIPRGAVTVVGWAGMRGVVSLAAALSLPTNTPEGPFPDRDLILFLTFGVILVTLVGQGMTLPLLIRVLNVSSLAERDEETPDQSPDDLADRATTMPH